LEFYYCSSIDTGAPVRCDKILVNFVLLLPIDWFKIVIELEDVRQGTVFCVMYSTSVCYLICKITQEHILSSAENIHLSCTNTRNR